MLSATVLQASVLDLVEVAGDGHDHGLDQAVPGDLLAQSTAATCQPASSTIFWMFAPLEAGGGCSTAMISLPSERAPAGFTLRNCHRRGHGPLRVALPGFHCVCLPAPSALPCASCAFSSGLAALLLLVLTTARFSLDFPVSQR
jgi:hypothetical protein